MKIAVNSGVDQSLVSNPYSSFYGGGMGQGIGNDYGSGGSQIHNSDYSQHRFLGEQKWERKIWELWDLEIKVILLIFFQRTNFHLYSIYAKV